MVAVCLSVEGSGVSFASGICCADAAAQHSAARRDRAAALRRGRRMALWVVTSFLDFGADFFRSSGGGPSFGSKLCAPPVGVEAWRLAALLPRRAARRRRGFIHRGA